VVNKVHQQ